MIKFWAEVWIILAVTFTVLYLIATLVGGAGRTQSLIFALIFALIFGPIAATVATALALVVYWLVVIEAH